MTKNTVNDIIEFISLELHNSLTSIANLKEELWFLNELDGIYQEIKNASTVDHDNPMAHMVNVMFLKAHNEFYIGMSQFLKSHVSKAFISLRIAIDASFNAYCFTRHPEYIKDFGAEKSPLQSKVFRRIKAYIKENPKDFPLAQRLVGIHETLSGFSAHASLMSVAYKYECTDREMRLCYFDRLNRKEFMKHYLYLLMGYFMVLLLFYKCFFKREFRILYSGRNVRIATFEKKLRLKYKQYK